MTLTDEQLKLIKTHVPARTLWSNGVGIGPRKSGYHTEYILMDEHQYLITGMQELVHELADSFARVAELEALVENLREDNAMLLAAHDAAAFVAAIPTDNQRGE